jgi:lipopolysaccharide export system permease protein
LQNGVPWSKLLMGVFNLYPIQWFSYDDNPDTAIRTVPFPTDEVFKRSNEDLICRVLRLNRTDEDLFRNSYHMYNLKQLMYSRDSLLRVMNIRQQNFAATMHRNYTYFSKLDMAKEVEPDSSLIFHGNFLTEFDEKETLEVIEKAMTASRSNMKILEDAKTNNTWQIRNIRRHDIEWHRKYTLSVACIVLFFVGAPLGAIIRKGGLGLPMVVSTILFILFHIASTTGDKYVRTGVLDAWTGMWMSTALFLPLGIWLTYKAVTDSPLMDSDAWGKLFRKREKVDKQDQ